MLEQRRNLRHSLDGAKAEKVEELSKLIKKKSKLLRNNKARYWEEVKEERCAAFLHATHAGDWSASIAKGQCPHGITST
ncbi:MAG: hypothetical protein ACKPKO_33580, partial [Candidatus Fonsibacter sp.]